MKKDKDFLRLQEDFESLVEDIEKGLVKNYAKGYKDLKKDLEKAYDKYSKDGVLTMDEMRKYKRLERLEKATKLAVLGLYKDNKKFIRQSMKEIIKTTEDKSFKIIKAKKSISPIARSFKIDDLIDQAVAGRVWTERIDHYGSNFVYDVHTIIRRGLEDGKTYTQVSRELRDKFGKDIGNTARIVRTESTRIHEHTTFRTMEEINKEVKLTKTWRTMRDGAVRSSHQVMEGQTVGIDEEFVLPSGATTLYPTGSGDPAEDINCRCYLEYGIEKEEQQNNIDEVPEESGNFFNATNDWKKVTKEDAKAVTELNSYKNNDVEYKVDKKHVVLDYSKHEREVADLIAKNYGKDVKMVPRVLYPPGIKTPDYLIDGEKWDLKTVSSKGKNVFYNLTKGKKEQADNFIFDISNIDVKDKWIEDQIKSIYNSKNREWIKSIIVTKKKIIIKAYKRK